MIGIRPIVVINMAQLPKSLIARFLVRTRMRISPLNVVNTLLAPANPIRSMRSLKDGMVFSDDLTLGDYSADLIARFFVEMSMQVYCDKMHSTRRIFGMLARRTCMLHHQNRSVLITLCN